MKFLISVAIILLWCGWSSTEPPEWLTHMPWRPPHEKHIEYAVIQRLHFLNLLITKDVVLKLRHAEKLQEKYKGTLSYELGTLAAGLIETFKHMLEVYRTYSNVTELTMNKYQPDDYYDAYHAIQGDYNEMLLESDMYYDILNKHIAKREEENMAIKMKYSYLTKLFKKTTKPIKRAYMPSVKRRSKAEEDYKQKMRQDKWLKKWNNFVPEIEGVDIELDFPDP